MNIEKYYANTHVVKLEIANSNVKFGLLNFKPAVLVYML